MVYWGMLEFSPIASSHAVEAGVVATQLMLGLMGSPSFRTSVDQPSPSIG